MTKRTTPALEALARTRTIQASEVLAYGYQIRCKHLDFSDDVLSARRKFAENYVRDGMQVDFKAAFLPPNRLHAQVTRFSERPDLARVVVAVVDVYMLRQQYTKSTSQTALTIARNVIRAIEYFWLRDIYHLKYVTPHDWERLLEAYAVGGWPHVLNLEQRVATIDMRQIMITRRKRQAGRTTVYSSQRLLAAIGTNLQPGSVKIDYKAGDVHCKLTSSRLENKPKESAICAIISHLNNLVELPNDMRAQCVAHSEPYKYAHSLARAPAERTENFQPADLAKLVAEASKWVSDHCYLIIELAEIVYADVAQHEMECVDEVRIDRLLHARERLILEINLGCKITSVARVGDWKSGIGLLGLIKTLLTACFVILGVFNGRRKDEIASRSVGLYEGAFKCIDQAFGIYECEFYCEKSSHGYRPFFINRISYLALEAAKGISSLAWRGANRNGGLLPFGRDLKMFCLPSRGIEKKPTWWNYSTDAGVELLCERAGNLPSATAPNAHMFRRAYAVVFFYRYEYAELHALMQQLDHTEIGQTLHYVLEGSGRDLSKHAKTLWHGDSARAEHSARLAKEVHDYSAVKLHDDVLSILRGDTGLSGGFHKLVQRFSRVMLGRIVYDDVSLRSASKRITETLVDRGHTVRPFAHGNCNAGGPKAGAHCFSDGRLARENASPTVCGRCLYHHMKVAHLDVVENDLKVQRARMAALAGTLQGRSLALKLEAAEDLIAFYRRKLAAA